MQNLYLPEREEREEREERDEREVAIWLFLTTVKIVVFYICTFSWCLQIITSLFWKTVGQISVCFFVENYMSLMISEPTNILRERCLLMSFKIIIHLLDALLRAWNKATASRATKLLGHLQSTDETCPRG
jgi:hypothetical protein